jgi:hypothetical protein
VQPPLLLLLLQPLLPPLLLRKGRVVSGTLDMSVGDQHVAGLCTRTDEGKRSSCSN